MAEKVDRLLAVGLSEKPTIPNGSRTNKTCQKDSVPLSHIDLMLDSTVGHCMLSFIDAYSAYNQITTIDWR